MKFSTFSTKNVFMDGSVKNGGAVHTEGQIQTSVPKGGCGAGNCNCSEGHWISIILPRTSGGVVKGITVKFKDRKEMLKVLKI